MKLLKNLLLGSKYFFTLKLFFPAVLTLLWFIIILNNYIPGTILSGWDTLHPEFNFPLNFERLIFGVWREEQGLGAVAAHAHMSDLPRVLLLWGSSFIFPLEFLRFFLISLCLLSGVLGVYYFMKYTFFNSLKTIYASIFSFLGALFYLFNLGTVQHFYVPFEMFTVQFGLLPWIFLSVNNYLKNPTRKNLLYLSITNILGTPMAYAPLLWYVYFGSLILYLSVYFQAYKKQVMTILSVTFLINSFWILPNLYFLISGNAAYVPDAKINKLFSEEAYLQNASFGTISDVVLFKNFLFNWPVYAGFDRFDLLLNAWRNHLTNPLIPFIGYLSAFIAVLGIIGGIVKQKKNTIAILLPLLVALFFMLSSTFPISLVSEYLRDTNAIFKEALRFPFTKFSIVGMFGFSVFFGLGNYYLLNILSKIRLLKNIRYFVLSIFQTLLISTLLIIYCLPMFQGELISRLMQVKIPTEYFQMFNYFEQKEDSGRVVVFPIHSLWGWTYYDWGFQGAQFITFGIKQPVLDRDWDRWNPKNEDMYRQLSYAAYSDNEVLFENVLNKYNIEFLVIDEHIISAGSENDRRSLNIEQIELLFGRIKKLKLDSSMSGISVYRYERQFQGVYTDKDLPTIRKGSLSEDEDQSYVMNGNYISAEGVGQNLQTNNLNFLDMRDVKGTTNRVDIKTYEEKTNFVQLISKESVIPFMVYGKEVLNQTEISLLPVYGSINNPDSGFKMYFSGTNYALLNFDNFQTIRLNGMQTGQYSFLGSVFISSSQFSNISIYSQSMENAEQITNLAIQPPLDLQDKTSSSARNKYAIHLCNKPDENQIFAAGDVIDGKLTIAAKNSNACVWLPLDKIVNADKISEYKSLIGFRYAVQSAENALGRFCLFDMDRERCVLEDKFVATNEDKSIFFTIDSSRLERFQIVLYLDGTEKDLYQELHYRNLSLSYYRPAETQSISPDEIGSFFQGIFQTDTSSFSIKDANVENFTIRLHEPGHTNNECNVSQATISERLIDKNSELFYKSKNGSSCDYFSLPNVSHALGYIVEIESKNISGLPLRVCIANPYSKRCDIYTTLASIKEFNKSYILVPPVFDGGVGYDIHFDNFAVGQFVTENALRSVRVIPIPYHYLRSQEMNQTDKKEAVFTNIELQKFLPGFYWTKIPTIQSGDILLFNQAFDTGWWSGIGKHVMVNGWQNGWLVDKGKEGYQLIYFWPELFELLSIIFVTVFFSYLFLTKSKK